MLLIRGLLLALFAIALLAACGGDEDAATVNPVDGEPTLSDPDETSGNDGADEEQSSEPTATPDEDDAETSETPTENPDDGEDDDSTPEESPTEPADDDETSEDATTLRCGDQLAPVNKQNALPEDCAPGSLAQVPAEYSSGYQELTPETLDALLQMFEGAAEDGHSLVVCSSYRSYQVQVDTYQYWVSTVGQEQADRTSARPGHSEHQLGTTADVQSTDFGCELSEEWGATDAGQWLEANAADYGFAISYPQGKESVTGYAYEPWHIRYVGQDVAQDVANSGATLTEYLRNQ